MVNQLPTAGSDWWNPQWRFRQPIALSNTHQSQRTDETVLLYLRVREGRLLDAVREVRVVAPDGREVPSAILFQGKNGSLTTGFLVLFFASLPPESTNTYQVYYGNPSSPSPTYRNTIRSDIYQNTLLLSKLRQSGLSLTYRDELYLSLLTTKVTVDDASSEDFGEPALASKRFQEVQGWLKGLDGNVTFTVNQAGNMTLVKLVRATAKNLEVWDATINLGPAPASAVLFDFLDFSPMSGRGFVEGLYNSTDNIGYARVSTSLIGYRGEEYRTPSGHDIGTPQTVSANVKGGTLTNSNQASGDLALSVEWGLGTLEPNEGTTIARYLTFESNYTALSASLKDRSSRVAPTPGPEEALPSAVPSAILLARDVNRTVLSIPQGGLEMPYVTPSSAWTPVHVSLSGTASYSLPGAGDYDFENPALWSAGPSSQEPGRFTIFSSAKTWSEAKQSHVASIRLWDNDTAKVVEGRITSPFVRIVGSQTTLLKFDYRVSHYLVTPGQPSAFLGLNFDVDLDGIVDFRLYSSAEGSVPSANATTLINDGKWNQAEINFDSVPLPTPLPRDFQVSVQLFASTNSSASTGALAKGIVEIEIDDVGFEIEGAADQMLTARLDPFSHNLTLAYARNGPSTKLLSSAANLTLTFSVATGIPVTPHFDGLLSIDYQNLPGRALTFDNTAVVLNGLNVTHLREVQVNSIILPSGNYTSDSTSIRIPNNSLQRVLGTDSLRSFTIDLKHTVSRLLLHVRDANNDPVPSGVLVISDVFLGPLLETNALGGEVAANLIPADYQLEMVYHNVSVARTSVSLLENLELTLPTKVFRQGFTILDALRLDIPGAELRLLRNESLLLRAVTDGGGRVAVQLAANSPYRMRVYLSGDLILERDFNPVVNNAQIVIQSSYVPLYAKVIVGAVVVFAASAFLLLPVRRSLRRRRRLLLQDGPVKPISQSPSFRLAPPH